MLDFIYDEQEAADIVRLVQSRASQQLTYVPERPYRHDYPRNSAVRVEVYSHIASGLAPYLRPENALPLLHLVRQEAEAAQIEHPGDDEYSFLGWSLVRDALCNIAECYVHLQAFDDAIKTAYPMTDEERQAETLATVALTLHRQGQVSTAQNTLTGAEQRALRIPYDYVQGTALSALFNAVLNIRSVSAAVELSLTITPQGHHITKHFHALIQVLMTTGHFSDALSVARTLVNRLDRLRGLATVALELATQGQHEQATTIVLELEREGVAISTPEDKVSFRCIVGVAYFKLGDVSRSETLFAQAAELAISLSPKGIPSPVCEYPLALATCGYFDRAYQAVQSLPSDWLRQEALRLLMIYLMGNRHFHEARRMAGLFPNSYLQAVWLVSLTAAMLKAGHLIPANEIIEEIIKRLETFDCTWIQPAHRYLTTQMLVRFHRIPEAFQYLDRAGIDEFLKALANAAPHFERLYSGLAVQVIKAALEVAVQKHADYGAILAWMA